MAKAVWNGVVIAESDKTVVVEDTHYFPMDSIQKHYFKSSGTSTSCPTKGQASYYHLEVNGRINPDAAWYYPQPRGAVSQIKDHVAFWKGVEIEIDGQVQSPAPAETPAEPKAETPAKAPAPVESKPKAPAKAPAKAAPVKAGSTDNGNGQKASAPAATGSKAEGTAGGTPPKPKPAPVAQVDETDGGPGETTPPVKTTATSDQTEKTEPAITPAPAVAKADQGDDGQEPPKKPAKATVADGSDLDELRPTG